MKKKGFRLPSRKTEGTDSDAKGAFPAGFGDDDTMSMSLDPLTRAPLPSTITATDGGHSFDARVPDEDGGELPFWGGESTATRAAEVTGSADRVFLPREPQQLEDTGLTPAFVEHLVLKYILENPGVTGTGLAVAIGLKPLPVRELLGRLKRRLLVVHSGGATADFQYDLTERGRNHAMHLRQLCPYTGPAPVTLAQYRESVRLQSIANEPVEPERLREAFSDLVFPETILTTLGPAMTSGRGLFLFGNSGNGKTSLSMRMTRAYSSTVYIPHAVLMNGTIVQIYDPQVHRTIEEEGRDGSSRLDGRWLTCARPLVVSGGELTLEALDLEETASGICEAPFQLKANCGIYLVDDFGRQRVDPREMLNRWIVPLENRVDYLRLPSGRTIQVPFDAFLVFSTNLEPRELVDEAFLRRIPYKVQVPDPTPESFRQLLVREAEALGFAPDIAVFNHVIDTHYHQTGREMRGCHPRDLLLQVRNRCLYLGQPLRLNVEAFEQAVRCYFTLL